MLDKTTKSLEKIISKYRVFLKYSRWIKKKLIRKKYFIKRKKKFFEINKKFFLSIN